jgi:GYF domain 2
LRAWPGFPANRVGRTGAHECKERTPAPLQSNLISYNVTSDEPKEWYYYSPPSASKAEAARAGAGAPVELARLGPVSRDDIRRLWATGGIRPQTPFEAAGMDRPAPLSTIRELRWWVMGGTGEWRAGSY